jgi:hypothetical protein
LTYKIDILPLRKAFSGLLCLFALLFSVATASAVNHFAVDLYGHSLEFNLKGDFYRQRDNCFSEDNIAASVDKLMQDSQMDTLIKQMSFYSSELKMDDMAFMMMLNKVTNTLMKQESDACKTLFKYVILQKKGLDVFIGYSESAITLYGRTNFLIENCIFIERGNKKYFDLSFSQQRQPHLEQMFVIHHPGKSIPIVMNMITPPEFNAKQAKKVLPFEYDGMVYFFTTRVNESLVEYYKDLPTINISSLYLNYGLSQSATKSLIKEMKEATSSMSTTEGVNFILRFVQTSFDYKKDQQVYGQEKFSFPEETITNKYSDCEDKAMLFAVLVNKVLGLKTVALYYKDAEHINVAVESWKKNLRGSFTFNDMDYIVCEPSGKGFNIGESATSVSYANLIEW